MRGYFKRKAVLLLLIAAILLPIIPAVSLGAASPQTAARMRELQELQRQARLAVSEQRNLLEGTYTEMSRVMIQIRILDQELLDAVFDLELVELSLLETEERIAEAELALEAARDELDRQHEAARQSLRSMHEAGPVGFLDVLIGAESFSDFFNRLEIVTRLAQQDHDRLNRLEQAERDVNLLLDQLSREHILISDLHHRYQMAHNDLLETLEERARIFEQLAEDAEALEELVAILAAEEHAINVELGLAQAQYRAEVAEAERRRREAEAAAARAVQAAALAAFADFDGQFVWPLPGHFNITSGFGMRTNPITRARQHHNGIDLNAPTGTRIVAAAAGVVRTAAWSGGFGLLVVIDHGNGYSTWYAHNSRNRVVEGQTVTAGQHIADVGTTGQSTGPHLHFEIRHNNVPQNPLGFFEGVRGFFTGDVR